MEISNEKFQVSIFEKKKGSFSFSIIRMFQKWNNINGAKFLRIARTSINPESFSTKIKPFVTCMSRQGFIFEKIKRVIPNF